VDGGTPDGAVGKNTDRIIGIVTSGTMSPMLKEGIGMGYVAAEFAAPGTEIAVIIRDKPIRAVVVKTPFV
jgi:aminomethyltransferase